MKPSAAIAHTRFIKQSALALGFDYCGIAKADFLEEEAPRLERWLNEGMHGQMHYMAEHFDKRLNPAKLVEGAKSVISLIYNYYPHQDLANNASYKIAKYAYGKDYHRIVKDKLRTLFRQISDEVGEIEGRVFVDSAPVHERAWAAKAGLGWIGKNSLLLNKKQGSFFFLAEIILDLELAYDSPAADHCGSCTACIDACPTDAIPTAGVVDGSRCISYLTIELKEAIPAEFKGKFEHWVFGCDICQDVCPWNRFSKPHREEHFLPHPELSDLSKRDWEEITEETFKRVFKKSAVQRTKFAGLRRNIDFAGE